MKISYATLVHNERVEIERLLSYLIKYKKSNDEIVIMLDSENVTKSVRDFVEDFVMQNKKEHLRSTGNYDAYLGIDSFHWDIVKRVEDKL